MTPRFRNSRRPQSGLIAGLAAIALLVASCTGTNPTANPAEQPTDVGASSSTPKPRVSIKVGTSSEIDEGELILLAAVEALKDEGIDVEVVEFAETDLAAAAIVSGQVDFGSINPPALVAANAAGADLRNFVTGEGNAWVLATPTSVTDVAQLEGSQIAHHGTGISLALTLWTLEDRAVDAEILSVPGGTARAAALLEGQIDATVIQFGQLETLKAQAPDQFHALLVYEDELPGVLRSDNYVAQRSTLESDPETWTTVTRVLIETIRATVEDPAALANRAPELLPTGAETDTEAVLTALQLNVDNNVYPLNGGITAEGFEGLLEFYVQYDLIDAEDIRPFDELATLEFVEGALADIGER